MGEKVFGKTIATAFDVSPDPGELAAGLATLSNLPNLNLQILVGFTLDYSEGFSRVPFDLRVSHGDFLISGDGQRFYPALTDNDSWESLLSEAKEGNATVSEFILGRDSVNDSRSRIIQELEPMLALGSPENLSYSETLQYYFTPFKHSGGSRNDIWLSYWHSQEVCVGCGNEGTYHDTYQRVLDWMKCAGEIQTDPESGVVSCKPKPPAPVSLTLNDTGITTCSNGSTNGLACPVVDFPAQDAQYGRDVTHNDDSDGHAGFSFTKLDANGNPVSASATSWSCVSDNVTGLTWEVKTDDGGLHDRDDGYNWYNTDDTNNGGHPGYADYNGNICYGYDSGDPASYCNTQAYVSRVNQAGWCGHKDWRMPTKKELENIVSLDRYEPAIDTDYFTNTFSSRYWSASSSAYRSDYAWNVHFGNGSSYYNSKSSYRVHVHLVRGGQ